MFLKECLENQSLDNKKKKSLKFLQLGDTDQSTNIFKEDFLEKQHMDQKNNGRNQDKSNQLESKKQSLKRDQSYACAF